MGDGMPSAIRIIYSIPDFLVIIKQKNFSLLGILDNVDLNSNMNSDLSERGKYRRHALKVCLLKKRHKLSIT